MKQKVKLTLPAIKKFRDAIANGNIGNFLIETGEESNAGSVKVKIAIKNRPWVVTIEARRNQRNTNKNAKY